MLTSEKVDGLPDLHLCAASCLHDLLNPLTALSLYIEILSKDKDMHNDLEPLLQSSAEIAKFSKQISLFLKGSSKIEVFDVHLAVQSSALLLHTNLQSNNIELIIQSVGKINIETNPLSFKRIFLNILSNSIDSYINIKGKKKIIIDIKSEKNNIFISVTDYGCGMDQKTLEHCSKLRFTTKPNGNGIGLWNINVLVKQLKGYIKIFSKKNLGTCIKLKFPKQCKKL